jgi:hypothetical protein
MVVRHGNPAGRIEDILASAVTLERSNPWMKSSKGLLTVERWSAMIGLVMQREYQGQSHGMAQAANQADTEGYRQT